MHRIALLRGSAQQANAPLHTGHLWSLDSLRLLLAFDRSRSLFPLQQQCRVAGITDALFLRRVVPPVSLQGSPDPVHRRSEEGFEGSNGGLQLKGCLPVFRRVEREEDREEGRGFA